MAGFVPVMWPHARRHLADLARCLSGRPVPVVQNSRRRHHGTAIRDIDASLAAAQAIGFEGRRGIGLEFPGFPHIFLYKGGQGVQLVTRNQ